MKRLRGIGITWRRIKTSGRERRPARRSLGEAGRLAGNWLPESTVPATCRRDAGAPERA
jgi:hypothetical protein